MTCASSSAPGGGWAGYRGPGEETVLARILGAGACIRTGAGFGLGVNGGGAAEPGEAASPAATLTSMPSGNLTAAIGDGDAGCSAAIDTLRGTLILRCDPFGLHGVYTTRIGETLWCASDPRLLRRIPGAPEAAADPAALHGYLCFSHVPVPHTLFAGIRSLAAGETVTFCAHSARHQPPPAWGEAPEGSAQEEATAHRCEEQDIDELRTRLRAAVQKRLGADRDVGVFLSGGLDSSLVAALLAEAGARVHLFTLDFGAPWDAELPYARQVAAHLGRPLHTVSARPGDIKSALEATAAALHQPFGDGVTVPLYLLGRAASGQVPVVWNGEGGDQLFGGWANKPMIAATLYGTGAPDDEAAYLATYHRFHGLTDRLYTPCARAATRAIDVGAWVRPALNRQDPLPLLHRLRAANLTLKGAQNIAPRAAALAACHGLRLRTPFFDRELAAWTFTLPPDAFLRGACEKYLLKRAAEPYLPPEVVWRDKRGMGVPLTDWCLGPLKAEAARRLSPRCLRRDGWFEPGFVDALRRGEDLPGEFRRRRVGEKLWTLLMLQVWAETHGHRLTLRTEPGN